MLRYSNIVIILDCININPNIDLKDMSICLPCHARIQFPQGEGCMGSTP